MTKSISVAVELLDQLAGMELDTTERSIKIQDELRSILAQPAEAEGVERWSELRALAESAPGENWKAGNAYGKPFIPTYQVIADTVDGPCVILEGNKNFIEQAKAAVTFAAAANPAAVRELIAALSAVTAERDRLREENETLESQERYREQERLVAVEEADQLRAEVEGLRKDAERYAHLKAAWDDDVLISYLDSNVHPSDWDGVIDADMSAKEA